MCGRGDRGYCLLLMGGVWVLTKEQISFLRKQIRVLVIERDEGKCVLCGKNGVDVHEVIPRSRFGRGTMDDCFSLENCALLCRSCHSGAHTVVERGRLLSKLAELYDYVYDGFPHLRYLSEYENSSIAFGGKQNG